MADEITVEVSENSAPPTFADILGNATDNESLNIELESKVDKVENKGLSTNDYTDEDKTKVDNTVTDLSEYSTTAETSVLLDNKANSSQVLTDVPLGALFTDTTYTDAEIKTKYENNADTNAFTDAEKTKVTNAVQTDGSTPFTATQQGIDGENDDDLATVGQIKSDFVPTIDSTESPTGSAADTVRAALQALSTNVNTLNDDIVTYLKKNGSNAPETVTLQDLVVDAATFKEDVVMEEDLTVGMINPDGEVTTFGGSITAPGVTATAVALNGQLKFNGNAGSPNKVVTFINGNALRTFMRNDADTGYIEPEFQYYTGSVYRSMKINSQGFVFDSNIVSDGTITGAQAILGTEMPQLQQVETLLGDYLPLTGGTLTGGLNFSNTDGIVIGASYSTITIGSNASNLALNSISIGRNAEVQNNSNASIAIGINALVGGYGSNIAIGDNAKIYGNSAVIIGTGQIGSDTNTQFGVGGGGTTTDTTIDYGLLMYIDNSNDVNFIGGIKSKINSKASHPTNYKPVYQDTDTKEYYTLT